MSVADAVLIKTAKLLTKNIKAVEVQEVKQRQCSVPSVSERGREGGRQGGREGERQCEKVRESERERTRGDTL
jgi:hypothetical protein